MIISKNRPEIFYIYIDSTLEETPRIFYVGKGKINRVRDVRPRNKKWKNIANKYGFKREKIFGSLDETFILEKEKEFIKIFNTYHWDNKEFGCNFTLGGEGSSGWKPSEEIRKKISIANKGRKISEKERLQRSIRFSGKNHPMYGRKGKDNPNFGRKVSDESRKLMSERQKGEKSHRWGKHWNDDVKKKISDGNRSFSDQEIIEIKNKRLSNEYTVKELAQEYSTSKNTIKNIIFGRRYYDVGPVCDKLSTEIKRQHSSDAQLIFSDQEVLEIKRRRVFEKHTLAQLAVDFKVCKGTIKNILSGKHYGHIKSDIEKLNGRIAKLPNKIVKLTDEQEQEIANKYATKQYSKKSLELEYEISWQRLNKILEKKLSEEEYNFNFRWTLSENDMLEIRMKYDNGETIEKLSKEYGVKRKIISKILNKEDEKKVKGTQGDE